MFLLLSFQPAQLKVRQYIQEVYKCSQCGKEGSGHPADVFVGGKVPVSLLPHSLASASLVAGILYKKYDMGIPLARQEREWYRLGLCLYRSTMANWVIRCSEEYLLPIYERIHQELLGCGILHGDETRIQCNREPGKKASSESFMWVIRSGREEAVQARENIWRRFWKTVAFRSQTMTVRPVSVHLQPDARHGCSQTRRQVQEPAASYIHW